MAGETGTVLCKDDSNIPLIKEINKELNRLPKELNEAYASIKHFESVCRVGPSQDKGVSQEIGRAEEMVKLQNGEAKKVVDRTLELLREASDPMKKLYANGKNGCHKELEAADIKVRDEWRKLSNRAAIIGTCTQGL